MATTNNIYDKIYDKIKLKAIPADVLAACQSKSAIHQVLGTLLLDPQRILENKIGQEDFIEPLFSLIFGTIHNLARTGVNELDIPMLENYLKENFPMQYEKFQLYRGSEFLAQAAEIAKPKNYAENCETLKKYTLLRKLMVAGIDVGEFYNPNELDPELSECINSRFQNASVEEIGHFYQNKIMAINDIFKVEATNYGCKAGGKEAKKQKETWKEGTTYGLSYASNFLTDATDGMGLGKLIIMSAATNVGKTRTALANIGHTFAREYWDEKEKTWKLNPNGTQNSVLYISTEQELREEIEPILEAYIAGVSEDHIKHPEHYLLGEEERVDKAIEVLSQSQIYMHFLPEYNLSTLERVISKYCEQYHVTHVFFDYVHVTTALSREYRLLTGQEGRDDQILGNVINKLKTWTSTSKYGICIYTSTQLNGEFGNDQIRDQRLLRGGKNMADKADYCGILSEPTKKETKELEGLLADHHVIQKGKIICLSLYKNRMHDHKNIKIWLDIDYHTMRVHDLFATYDNMKPYPFLRKVVVHMDEDTKKITYYKDNKTMLEQLKKVGDEYENDSLEDLGEPIILDDGVNLNDVDPSDCCSDVYKDDNFDY